MRDVVVGYFILLLYLNRIVDNVALKLLPVIILVWLAVKYHRKNKLLKRSKEYKSERPKIFYALVLLLIIGLLRSNSPDSTITSILSSCMSFAVFVFLTTTVYEHISLKYDDNISIYHKIIIGPFFLFAICNIIFWMLGFRVKAEETDIGTSVLLSQIGISINRVSFPFANGINSYAAVIGGLFSLELVYFFLLKQRNWFSFSALSIFLFTLLLTDSRAAIIYPIIILFFLFWLNKKSKINPLRFLPWITIIGPFLLVTIMPILSKIPFFEQLSRSSEDLATGNARFVIWGIAFNELLHFQIIHLTGYGIFGHIASGVSSLWSSFFGYMENADSVHPHNTLLSIIFDYGYIGIFTFLLFLFKSSKRLTILWLNYQHLVLFYLGFIIYYLIISITESFFGFYYLNSIYLILLVLLLPFNIRLNNSKISDNSENNIDIQIAE